MGNDDVKRVQGLIDEALKNTRSREEISSTFQAAGIIDNDGNLKDPYKEIYIPG